MSLVGQSFQDTTFRAGWVGGTDTGDINPLLAEEHLAGFQQRITEDSLFQGMTQKKTPAEGSDTFSWKQSSGAELTKLARGVIPAATSGTVEKLSLEVDTILITRTPIARLDLLIQDPDVLPTIAREHATEILTQYDRLIPRMAIKAAQISAKTAIMNNGVPTGTFEITDGWYRASLAGMKAGWTGHERNVVAGFRGGCSVELPALGWKDWAVLQNAMTAVMIMLGKKNIDQIRSGGKWFVSWDIYGMLLNNDRFTPMNFTRFNSQQTDRGLLDTVYNIPIIPTNRLGGLAEQVGTSDLMSNARNGLAYDVTLDDARCCAVWFNNQTLRELELINHHSMSFFDDLSHTRYIDDLTCYAVGIDRLEYAAAIFKNAAEFATAQDIIDAGGSSDYVPGTSTLW